MDPLVLTLIVILLPERVQKPCRSNPRRSSETDVQDAQDGNYWIRGSILYLFPSTGRTKDRTGVPLYGPSVSRQIF